MTMGNSITHERWLLVLLHVVIYVLLQIGYIFYVAHFFEYMGFDTNVQWEKLLFGVASIALLAFVLPLKRRPSSLFLHFILAAALTPALVLTAGAGLPWEYAMLNIFALLVVAAVAGLDVEIPLPQPIFSASFMLLLLCGLSVSVVFLVWASGGHRYVNFNFSLLYDLRRDAADAISPVFAYAVPATTKAILPLALALALVRRQGSAILVAVLCFILFGAMSNNRAPFFYPVLIVAIILFSKGRQPTLVMLSAAAILVFVGIIDGMIFWLYPDTYNAWLATLGLRRTLMIPALLNFYYWEFFSTHRQLMWSDSLVSMGIADNPHGIIAPRLIGVEYFGGQETNANTGWIGSGMAQAGMPGVVLYSVGVGVVLLMSDRYAKRLGYAVSVAIFAIPMRACVLSNDFMTLFLTHGLAALLVLASIVSVENGRSRTSKLGEHSYCE